MTNLKKLLSIIVIGSLLTLSLPARADSSREFIMSVTYGTLAGTLLGVASLAFEDKPSNKLQNVARGASLGLYAGILLGLYVVYAVPDENDELNKILPPDENVHIVPSIYPVITKKGKVDGAGVQLSILNF